MAKIVRHDFSGIHKALNELIIAEVKAALALLPGKSVEADGRVPLCHLVISPNGDYAPRDVSVRYVTLQDNGRLAIGGTDNGYDHITEYDEDDDMLDITDFAYLIDRIAVMVEDGKTAKEKRRIRWSVYRDILEDAIKVAAQKVVTV